MNPWDDNATPPRQAGWGCLAATVIGSIASVIAVIIIVKVIASTFPW